MLVTTTQIVRTALAADPSVSVGERHRLLKLLREGPPAENTPPVVPVPAILTRKQTAERFNRSLRFVDGLAKSGILSKVRLPGRIRCCGFREADVVTLIEGKGTPA